MILVGEKIGRWSVVAVGEPYSRNHIRYNCVCECGTERLVRESTLLSGESRSCGCLARELASLNSKTHGLSKHPLYNVWRDMNRRCYDNKRKDYKHYGARGISVCDDWRNADNGLETFISEMYPSFIDGLELDRIDVDGNYCKDNCQWTTRRMQCINQRDRNFIEYNGKSLCISQWADETGIDAQIITDRLGKLGWGVEKALTTKVKAKRILVDVAGDKFGLEDVFKRAPNCYRYAHAANKDFYQYCADIFNGLFDVYICLNKTTICIEPKENCNHLLYKHPWTPWFQGVLNDKLLSLSKYLTGVMIQQTHLNPLSLLL